jgi:hypothetical protein
MLHASSTMLALLYLCQWNYLWQWTQIPVFWKHLMLQLSFAMIHLLLFLQCLLSQCWCPNHWTKGDVTISSRAVTSNEGDVSTEGAIESAAVVSLRGRVQQNCQQGQINNLCLLQFIVHTQFSFQSHKAFSYAP